MNNGFIKTAAFSVPVSVADTQFNERQIESLLYKADASGVSVAVFPELSITGCSCGDLFYSNNLLESALAALTKLKYFSANISCLFTVGLPIKYNSKLFDCTAVICSGEILAVVPKTNLSKNQLQVFSSADCLGQSYASVQIDNEEIPFGKNFMFRCADWPEYTIAVACGNDLSAFAQEYCESGAKIICNPTAEMATVSTEKEIVTQLSYLSDKNICTVIRANSHSTESTGDGVYGGDCYVVEKGTILAHTAIFGDGEVVADTDLQLIDALRQKDVNYKYNRNQYFTDLFFNQYITASSLDRTVCKTPFVPEDINELDYRCNTILNIQANGIKKRLEHTRSKTAVIGISGGLDSCLALIATVMAIDLAKRDRKDIIAITMPCFGTTNRTRNNAKALCDELGVTFVEINIKDAVTLHFKDIGHPDTSYDTTYENSQARERTQILMDYANRVGGIVIGTGDLSELALGWATYNGDHMSMYAVNSSIPKTLIRSIIDYYAKQKSKKLYDIICDILDTPVSPELLPANSDGDISQKTEDLVGPYVLHDFFIYHYFKYGFSPAKIFFLAKQAFDQEFTDTVILKWLKTFFVRYTTQQFKRSCMPDGPKVGSVNFSPRGELNMPSDASVAGILAEIESLIDDAKE